MAFWKSSSIPTMRLLPLPGKTGDNLLIHHGAPSGQRGVSSGLRHDPPSGPSAGVPPTSPVNGKKGPNIPSYLVKAGDVIEVAESSRSSGVQALGWSRTRLSFRCLPPPGWAGEEGTLKGTPCDPPSVREEIEYSH